MHVDPRIALGLTQIVGLFVRDVTLTRDEIRGLMGNLLVTDSQPNAPTRFSEWRRGNADKIGVAYAWNWRGTSDSRQKENRARLFQSARDSIRAI